MAESSVVGQLCRHDPNSLQNLEGAYDPWAQFFILFEPQHPPHRGYLQEHIITCLEFEVPFMKICIAFLSALCGEYSLLDFMHRCVGGLNQL